MSQLQPTLDTRRHVGGGRPVGAKLPAVFPLSNPPPSRGSKNHDSGMCRPCRAFGTPHGCSAGPVCNFCHYDHDVSKFVENAYFTCQAKLQRASRAHVSSRDCVYNATSVSTACADYANNKGTGTPTQSEEGKAGRLRSFSDPLSVGSRASPGLGLSVPMIAAEERQPTASCAGHVADRLDVRSAQYQQRQHGGSKHTPTTQSSQSTQFQTPADIFHLL